MTPFCFSHEFRGEQRRYWELFFDDAAMRVQLDAGGMKSYEIEELSRDNGVWRRVVRATPARDLPAIIRKVTGASLGYTEETIFDEAAQTAVTTVTPSTLGGRIDFRGTHRLHATGTDTFNRIFEGNVEVRVALVGGKIEKLIIADMEKSYTTGAELTQRGLAAANGSA